MLYTKRLRKRRTGMEIVVYQDKTDVDKSELLRVEAPALYMRCLGPDGTTETGFLPVTCEPRW